MALLSLVYDPIKFPVVRLKKELEVEGPFAFGEASEIQNRYSLYTGDPNLAHMLTTMLIRITGMCTPYSDPSMFYMMGQIDKVYEELREAWIRGYEKAVKNLSERGSRQAFFHPHRFF